MLDEPVRINDRITVPTALFTWSFARSGGPGGQHVNTTDTRARLRFDMASAAMLSPAVKARLAAKHPQWVTADGAVNLSCDRHRQRHRNVETLRERLAEAIRAALVPPKPRRPTRPSRNAKRKRLDQKKQRGSTKKMRGRVRED
jgi:ribosome-associated protein